MRRVRVVVVDDSLLIRQVLAKGLSEDPRIEVIGVAADPYEARDLVVQLSPDVLTLDIEMPKMDGLSFLRRLLDYKPMPVVMVSSLTRERAPATLEALDIGAVDIVAKPTNNVGARLTDMMAELREKVVAASKANVRRRGARTAAPLAAGGGWTHQILAIGASTGGTEALSVVLAGLPPDCPGTLVVQHMPAAFTGAFARRLDKLCAVRVVEATHGAPLVPGTVLIAPGGQHLRLVRREGTFLASVAPGDPVQGHCPSVDVMMQSVATIAGDRAVGAVLTGMGADGAAGLLALRRAGARTLAQDEATSVVYGMPRMAVANGAAEVSVGLDDIAGALVQWLRAPHRGSSGVVRGQAPAA
jgi:two-component system chemotaxis response regulator CheB